MKRVRDVSPKLDGQEALLAVWRILSPEDQVVLFLLAKRLLGQRCGLREAASELGVDWLTSGGRPQAPQVARRIT